MGDQQQLNVGDRVKHTTDGRVGNVVAIRPGGAYTVKWDGGLGEETVPRAELTPLD